MPIISASTLISTNEIDTINNDITNQKSWFASNQEQAIEKEVSKSESTPSKTVDSFSSESSRSKDSRDYDRRNINVKEEDYQRSPQRRGQYKSNSLLAYYTRKE